MGLELIALGYAGVGVAIAGALAAVGRATVRDCALVVALWPLYAPILAVAGAGDSEEQRALAALADHGAARDLAGRLAGARHRLRDLDALLARPDFDPAAAERRAGELAASGAPAAAAAAQLRARTLGRLEALRARYRSELAEVGELVAQLAAQSELVRLGSGAPTTSSDLIDELIARVEALGAVVDDHPE
jgi:hypothetical protein